MRQLLVGLAGLLLVVGVLFTVQLVRRDLWMSTCTDAGGAVLRHVEDATPYVAPGARTSYSCEGSDGTIGSWN